MYVFALRALMCLRYNRAMIRLVVFLGNTGREYESTRHNTGWLFAHFLFGDGISWSKKHNSHFATLGRVEALSLLSCEGRVPADVAGKLLLQKPLTYMNLSGQAVSHAAHFHKIPPQDILVVHDEIELPLGTLSLKYAGGLAGHNGLRSIKASLGTADFWRLRFGVGKPASGDVAGYVLSPFSADEQITLQYVFQSAKELFCALILSPSPDTLLKSWAKVKVQ